LNPDRDCISFLDQKKIFEYLTDLLNLIYQTYEGHELRYHSSHGCEQHRGYVYQCNLRNNLEDKLGRQAFSLYQFYLKEKAVFYLIPVFNWEEKLIRTEFFNCITSFGNSDVSCLFEVFKNFNPKDFNAIQINDLIEAKTAFDGKIVERGDLLILSITIKQLILHNSACVEQLSSKEKNLLMQALDKLKQHSDAADLPIVFDLIKTIKMKLYWPSSSVATFFFGTLDKKSALSQHGLLDDVRDVICAQAVSLPFSLGK
jgi:hypothetical protein